MTPEVQERIRHISNGEIPEGYKKTKFGILPTDWKVVTIGECLERVERPVDAQPDQMYTQIGIRSHGKGLFYKEPVSGAELGNKSVYWIEPDCFILNIVFAWEQAIARTRQTEVGMIGSHRFPMYKPVKDLVDIDYLVYFFQTKRGTDILEAASPGGAGRNRTLGQDRFLKSKIVLPSIAEQKRIVAILEKQDNLIYLHKKLLSSKQLQKDALMRLFWKGAKSNAILSDIATITMGQSPDSASYNEEMNGIPLIQGNADIKNRYTYPRLYTTAPTKETKSGDILLSVRAPVGTVAKSNINACIGRGMCAINAGALNEYVYQYLLYHEDKWGNVSQGSTFEAISATDIGKLKIPMIDKMAQKVKLLSAYDKEIMLRTTAIEQEQKKKKALMQLVLTGTVRVNNE